MNMTCKGTTNAGERCRAIAVKDGLCALHSNPKLAAEMGRMSGKVRRSRKSLEQPPPELASPQTAQEVRIALGQFISDVRARRLDSKLAGTLGYLANVLLKSIEISDVEARLASLENVARAGARKDQPGK
jgi:Family of unknown function (DUF5763)